MFRIWCCTEVNVHIYILFNPFSFALNKQPPILIETHQSGSCNYYLEFTHRRTVQCRTARGIKFDIFYRERKKNFTHISPKKNKTKRCDSSYLESTV